MNSFTNWNDELLHSGIPGQRKGVRRFQNYDGTLTPAGKERYRKTPEHLGYTPLKGKRGDIVQKSIGRETAKLEKRADKLTAKREKQLQKNNGIESARSKKLAEKAKSAVNGANFRRKMQKAYADMAPSDRAKVKAGYLISRYGGLVLGGAIGGAIAGAAYGASKSKLIEATDKKHGYERYYGIDNRQKQFQRHR